MSWKTPTSAKSRIPSFLLGIGLLIALPLLAGCAYDAPAGSSPEGELNTYTVEVSAGDFERRGAIVSFSLPQDAGRRSYELVGPDGRAVPAQVDGREVTFIIDELAAGEAVSYELRPSKDERGSVRMELHEGAVAFEAGGKPVVHYRAAPGDLPLDDIDEIYHRGGYLHPVLSPDGHLVTGDYPPDHPHHHGIWSTWAHTEYEGRQPDFWNMGDGTGLVEVDAVNQTWSGPVHGGVRARHHFVDMTADEDIVVLAENWVTHVYQVSGHDRPVHIFDLEIQQENITSSPLILPEYRYGGVGFRGNEQWLGEDNTEFLTSEGRTREDGHATRARWCHVGGYVDGNKVGIAILGHPDNFGFPEPMRIHPSEPFFNFAPQQLGDFSIDPGETHEAKYRYVVYDGEPDPEEIDRLWHDYAYPPEVTVTRR